MGLRGWWRTISQVKAHHTRGCNGQRQKNSLPKERIQANIELKILPELLTSAGLWKWRIGNGFVERL